MSIDAAADFFRRTVADEALRDGLAAAIAGAEPEAKADAVARFAHLRGFDFTAAEALQIRAAARRMMHEEGAIDEELDELDLEAVTGGSASNADKINAAVADQKAAANAEKGAGASDNLASTAGAIGGALGTVAAVAVNPVGAVAGAVVSGGETVVSTAKSIFSGW